MGPSLAPRLLIKTWTHVLVPPQYSLVSSKFHLRVDCPTADVTLTPRAAAEQTVLHAAQQARYLAELVRYI